SGFRPSPELLFHFDDNLRQAFRRETELFFDSIVRENRSVLDLLDADYTFLNERLAKHYGISGVYGERFRKVSLPPDSVRRGLLGQGSILTGTSRPNRTSPVIRGKWILENIFGAAPPPPPANVPELKEERNPAKILPMREQMSQHRANPVCASCHAQMDELGFALENFDAIGEWREIDAAGSPIDASAKLPDGTALKGPVALRKVLLNHSDEFLTTITEKLLTYALGRGLEAAKAPRFAAIYCGNGANMNDWTPATEGAGFEFSPILKPLEPFRDRTLVVTGLDNFQATDQGDSGGQHPRAAPAFMSCVHPKQTEGADVRAGTTIDQMIARQIGRDSKLSSLEVALDRNDVVGACDHGYACAYMNSMSWKTPTMPLPAETSPRF